ncbi:MAG: type II toxin-antitoxin system VapC family toxin [Terriglobales bacterium]
MRSLLDSHTLLWWFIDPAKLSNAVSNELGMRENSILVSPASIWELAIKSKSGKLDAQGFLDRVDDLLMEASFELLPITPDHAVRAGFLPQIHRDPFDRMLAAQAQAESLTILSKDAVFDHYGVRRLW